ncbi:endonuclease/exonuclease/phosphatase family protein [Roseovarius sp. D0-M9]|uniref:endonuclease/exonuclease/phosphatase family protein n=1 Tax=Roseovarius sp. D0-M9 TaxID=3127117 RepID=UPI0030101CC0
MGRQKGRYRKIAAFIVLAALVALTIVSFVPLIESNIWWIRFMDFPRLQLAVAVSVLLASYIGLRGWPTVAAWLVLLSAVGALSYQAYKLHPYSQLVEQTLIAHEECEEDQSLRIMVANVKRENDAADAFLDQVTEVDPDLLLIMETDAWWDARLAALHDRFPHRRQSIPEGDSFYGMHLFSKLNLIEPEFRYFFDSDTPTAVTKITLRGGDTINFIGLHPKPPLAWSQPTTMRDAHLLQAALLAREADVATIVAGDFNAVPWERVTRRAMRIGVLLDPRVGRGFFATYDTQNYLISWPLDHILFQQQLRLQSFERLPDFGSDHLAVVTTLCHAPSAVQKAPSLHTGDLAEAEKSIEMARDFQNNGD